MKGEGLSFVNRYADLDTVFGSIPPRELDSDRALAIAPELRRSRRHLLFARVHEHIGRTNWAKETVEAALASHLPVGPKAAFKRLASRLP
jgi:hypothetical protein